MSKNVMFDVAGDMTPEGGEETKVGERSAGENIVTMVTMEHDMEEVSEDNAAEAQDYFKEGYSSELAQVCECFLQVCFTQTKTTISNNTLSRLRPFWMKTQISSRTTS